MPKITLEPPATAANRSDLFVKVNDPLGTPVTQKVTGTQVRTMVTSSENYQIVDNTTDLLAAITFASTVTPNALALSATNRYTIYLLPASYVLTDGALIMATEFVDLVGIGTGWPGIVQGTTGTQQSGIQLTSPGDTLTITANDCYVANMAIITSSATKFAIKPTTNKSAHKWRNLHIFNTNATATASMPGNITYSGEYVECIAINDGSFAFGNTAVASGTFIRCRAGARSFGGGVSGTAGQASGLFIDCQADGISFGDIASGTFINCRFKAVTNVAAGMFGRGTATGTFINCIGNGVDSSDVACFGNTVASGKFYNCATDISLTIGRGFGSQGAGGGATTSGTFINCSAGSNSFGGGTSTASGTFKYCTAIDNSFAGGINGGTASGTFEFCTGGDQCFGGGGQLTGKFRHCNGGSNSFGNTISTAGIIEHCFAIDDSFGSGGAKTINGTIRHCSGRFRCFAGEGGTISGTAIIEHCSAQSASFAGRTGGNGGTISANAILSYCTAGDGAFAGSTFAGGTGGTAAGNFTHCIGGNASFAGASSTTGTGGTASGNFYFCSAGSASFAAGNTGGAFSGVAFCCQTQGGSPNMGSFGASNSGTTGSMSGSLIYCRIKTPSLDVSGFTPATITGVVYGCDIDNWRSVYLANTADSTTIANTAAETNFDKSQVLAARQWVIGKRIRLTAYGKYSTLIGAPGTAIFRIKFGANVLATSGTFTLVTSITNGGWKIDSIITCRTIGGTGTFSIGSDFDIDNGALAGANIIPSNGTVTISTIVDQTLQISIQMSVNDPANTFTLENLVVELLNQGANGG